MAHLEQATLSGGPSPWRNATRAGFQRIRRLLSDWRRRTAFRRDVGRLDRSGGLDVILEDLGFSRWEMDKIARGYPEAERLLPEMAARRGLDLDRLDPPTLFDLRHTCLLCEAHRACRQSLASGGADEAGFCPNGAVFARLAGAAQA